MPLVRIEIIKGKSVDYKKEMLDAVHTALMNAIQIEDWDRFQRLYEIEDKLNYELLGIGNAVHMHWHFFPRREGDTPEKGPVWKLDKAEMYAEKYRPNTDELENLKAALLVELNKLESIEGLGF